MRVILLGNLGIVERIELDVHCDRLAVVQQMFAAVVGLVDYEPHLPETVRLLNSPAIDPEYSVVDSHWRMNTDKAVRVGQGYMDCSVAATRKHAHSSLQQDRLVAEMDLNHSNEVIRDFLN